MTLNESLKTELIESTKTLIQHKSVKAPASGDAPFGEDIKKTLLYMLELGQSMGFKTKNIDNYAGYIEFGEGQEMLGILCHLDVVPEGDGWTYPPFSGTEVNGRIYGRGTLDDKGPAMASLFAMKALKESGFKPNKRVRLILGTDEESGSECMDYYLKHEETPTVAFSPDADFPVIHGEMGIILMKLKKVFVDKVEDGGIKIIHIKGGNAPNMVPDYAEAKLLETTPIKTIVEGFNASKGTSLTYEKEGDYAFVKAYGKSAHGSTPEEGVNAISMLLEFLDLIDLEIGDASNFVRFFNRTIGMTYNGENFGIGLEDDYNKLVLNLGLIDVNEDEGSVVINIRYPITVKESLVRIGIENTVESGGLDIEGWRHVEPLFFEPTHPLVTTLMDVYKNHTGDQNAKPLTIGGGTYARSIPNAIAFGALLPGREDNMHQKDEYILVDDLIQITEIFISAIEALSQS